MPTNDSPTQGSPAKPAAKGRRLVFAAYFMLATTVVACGAGIYHYSVNLRHVTDVGNKRINLAGRQRALSQRMTKALLLVERDTLAGAKSDAARGELVKVTTIFDKVLHGFNEGGDVPGTDGSDFAMPASTDEVEQKVIREALDLWSPLRERLAEVSGAEPTAAALAGAVEYARARNVPIFDLMNQLTNRTEVTAAASIAACSGPRNVLIGLGSIACFLIPGFYLWNRARRARARVERARDELATANGDLERHAATIATAKQETDRIMDTVQEGLLLIDPKGIIGPQYSKELTRILRQPELAGMNLLTVLQRLLTEKVFASTRTYFELLFDPSLKEKQILKVNPLVDIEVNFANPDGGFITRYLGFGFRRIVENGVVTRVFVAVRDITAQIELERRLRETEKKKERQLEMLLGIVHVEPAALDDFVQLIETELARINAALRAEDFADQSPERNDVLREHLTTVYRAVHNIKGNAAYLALEYFQKAAETFEAKIQELLNRPALTGDDFLSIVVAQGALRSDLADLVELRGKLTGIRRAEAPRAAGAESPPADPLGDGLRTLVADASARLQREAVLDIDPAALPCLGRDRADLVRDVLIQLARNSLAHSVESPAERERAGKPRAARLSVRSLPRTEDGLVGFAFRDDGTGLDLEKIRRRAESLGLLPANERHSPADIARCIFAPGFSTAETSGPDAGRGIGMDIIKDLVVEQAGGMLDVRSVPGRYCEFSIYLPEFTEPAAV